MKALIYVAGVTMLLLSACTQQALKPSGLAMKQKLGEQLFNDVDLSRDGTQSCAGCHDSAKAFIDPRPNITSANQRAAGAVSLGQDDVSLGDINTPTITYNAYIPEFHFDKKEGLYIGGLFLNGRASNLAEQATEPFLDPVEMQNTQAGVVATVRRKYGPAMQAIYGDKIFRNEERAFRAIGDAIAAFEKRPDFATFDAKFDLVMKGRAQFSELEKRGLDLFKDENKGNCAACHSVPDGDDEPAERLFTDFSYDNLGVPVNERVRAHNGKPAGYVDLGLFNNPQVNDPALKGAFRVSTLRNIAVTAPYMHNGVFNDLETVVQFYNSRDVAGALNPETGKPWRKPEIAATMNRDELGNLGLSDDEVRAIVAFMKTLTDARYQHLVD